ncbi:NADH pyrophosphatase [Pasteurella multocida subsp. multocida str. Anand1_cattle]|nr:NADH pyrophosphatase [Pasteurella multocida subsp. multocida str. Anand1_cattle]
MNAIQPDDAGYWLLTQDSALYLINGELPQGKAADFQLQGYNGMIIGELNGRPLWLVEEIADDQRTYSLYVAY